MIKIGKKRRIHIKLYLIREQLRNKIKEMLKIRKLEKLDIKRTIDPTNLRNDFN